ncbi:VWA domain-containing protein [Streptomyces sp. PSKA28]|uniref:VWA domain-containing protein n=1 Tax=Streptomyces himalayensis subsp. himalayensis TaxID=2756131 RepID=A0A7W0DTA5_9ACTN|nr:VWA domain-containing protein [Streptomyces himalayensis subsp. himalayensis]
MRDGATNRVVLLSDALANTGETSADAILERIADARREHGLTLFGVGVGSQYGDALMERLADKGDGHTTYVSNVKDARTVFCEQLRANIELRADSRAPHEASGQIESGALDGPLWQAGSGLRVAAVAAYFADALRTPAAPTGTGRWDLLPGAPSMPELANRAEELAYTTRDETVRGLADAVRQADRLRA